VCEEFTIFPYGQYENGIKIKLVFKNVFVAKSKLALTRYLLKYTRDFDKKITRGNNFAASRISATWHWHYSVDCVVPAAECLDSSAVGIARLAHAVGESILCREGRRRGSSRMTLCRTYRLAHLQCESLLFRSPRLSSVCLSRVRSRILSETDAKFRRLYRKSGSPSKTMTSDFAPEVSK